MASTSDVPGRVGVDFGREYCSLAKPHTNCWRVPRVQVHGHSPYDDLLARPTASPPRISRPTSGGLGWFDDWPVELLMETLENLDFKSLSAFSRVSVAACNAVRALPAYRELLEHAGGALSVLGKTGLLAHHSVSSLRSALRSPYCAVCSRFGAFLFMPTCQRACAECLTRELEFMVDSPAHVRSFYGLTKDQMASIPELRILTGAYAGKPQRMGDCWIELYGSVVSVKQAGDLAAQLGVRPTSRYLGAQLYGEQPDPGRWEKQVEYTLDDIEVFRDCAYSGPSYVRFPFLAASGRVDNGRWCRGCLRTRSDFLAGKLPGEVITDVSTHAVGGCVATHIGAMASRLWSEEEFAKHVTHCYGARAFSARWHHVHQEMQERGFQPWRMAPVRHITALERARGPERKPYPRMADKYEEWKIMIEEHRQYVGDLAGDERPTVYSIPLWLGPTEY
ncbi:uncharacterized protein B0H64DRAFT_469432 [Chaetomium fimeti]|uniref:F-box domain-containing protein n=1 Tax=Chaetomium fimeti TaxID=1854472 RepID=A0AAE0H835_9PEZI|nr:hypothetical protein B0H64DRAFT_469432 [Chaetomium fimeti]